MTASGPLPNSNAPAPPPATSARDDGGREVYFQALDARTGTLLWKASLGGQIVSAPITYEVDGKQNVSVVAGHTLVAFALRD